MLLPSEHIAIAAIVLWSAAVSGELPGRLHSSLDLLNTDTFDADSRTCEPIYIERCKNFGYNMTGGPNFVGYTSQLESEDVLLTFEPLIHGSCSSQLETFLCSAYVPMCSTKVEQLIGPCRPVCENVKNRCLPILRKFGFQWPGALNCSIFPEFNSEQHMCMEFPEEPSPPTHTIKTTAFPKSTKNYIVPPKQVCKTKRNPQAYRFINATGECMALCDKDNLFAAESKALANVLMAVCTALCLVSSTLSVATFLLDTSKFHYPERGIVFLSLCYALYSLGYLVRLIAGRDEVTCDTNGVMTQGLDNTNCAAVFLMLYYFGTAAAVWWIILSLTWLLSAGLKWSHEAIDVYSSYFHLVAWAVPAIQSIAIIVLRDISSEELTGLCFVGNNSSQSLLGFVVGPLAAYLLLGIGLLVAGFIVLVCHDKLAGEKNREKIEGLIVRIGVFSVLYTVPATCLIACYFYEYLNLYTWYDRHSANTPSYEIYMLKIIASLLPGVASGLCILISSKSMETWSHLCQRPCHKDKKSANRLTKYSNTNTTAAAASCYTPVNHSEPLVAGPSSHIFTKYHRHHCPSNHQHSTVPLYYDV